MEVIWAKGAVRSLNAVLKYWINRNKSDVYSKKLYKIISEELLKLSSKIGAKIFIPSFEPDKLIIEKKYSIFYKVGLISHLPIFQMTIKTVFHVKLYNYKLFLLLLLFL